MTLALTRSMTRWTAGCACATALGLAGCADGRDLPISPTVAASGNGASAATQVSSGTGSARALRIEKTCDAADHCTVITAVSGPLPVGTEVFYSGPLLDARTTSGIRVVLPNEQGTADGHCSVSYRTGTGKCVLTGGTGLLAGIHANLSVSSLFEEPYPDGLFIWDGTFRYTPGRTD